VLELELLSSNSLPLTYFLLIDHYTFVQKISHTYRTTQLCNLAYCFVQFIELYFKRLMDIDTKTTNLLKNETKRRAWIIYQLSLQNSSIASLARGAGMSRQAMWQALVKPYPNAERIIAGSLDMAPHTLFPERYGDDGLPNRKRGRPAK